MKSGHQTWPSHLIFQSDHATGGGLPSSFASHSKESASAKNLPAIAKKSVEGEATRPNLMSEVDLVV